MTRSNRRLRQRRRGSEAHGAPLARLMALAPGLGGRLLLYVVCFAIMALGVLELTGG